MTNRLFTVAIVDDSPLMRESARFRLKRLGYEVLLEAENGQDFLHKLEAKKVVPDICLLDINMPVMDGFETARCLKENWPEIRVLFHSMENGDTAFNGDLSWQQTGFVSKSASSRDFEMALLKLTH